MIAVRGGPSKSLTKIKEIYSYGPQQEMIIQEHYNIKHLG